MKPQNWLEIMELTKKFIPELYKAAVSSPGLSKYMEDWCRLASFLTEEVLVHNELKKLNSRLVTRLNNLLKNSKPNDYKDATGKFKLPAKIKLLKILEDELNQVEAIHKFNRGQSTWTLPTDLNKISGGAQTTVDEKSQIDMPSGAPTLSGFVDPVAFRKLLFRHGYHWIDPGAGAEHGAYTHRLQWYCIVSAARKVAIHVEYVQLFRGMSMDMCVTPDGSQTLWDLLFDCFVTSIGGKQREPISDTYRSPEKLHGFIRKATTLTDRNFSLLSAIITFSHERERGDWINKLVGVDMKNISLALGPTQANLVIEGADGVLVWPKVRVPVNQLQKDALR